MLHLFAGGLISQLPRLYDEYKGMTDQKEKKKKMFSGQWKRMRRKEGKESTEILRLPPSRLIASSTVRRRPYRVSTESRDAGRNQRGKMTKNTVIAVT